MSSSGPNLNVVRFDESGEAHPDAEASREQLREQAVSWRFFQSTADLTVLLRPGAHGITDQAFARAVLAGDLAAMNAADLVNFLAQGKSTGVLFARSADVDRTLTFREGRLCWASSTARPERLGEISLRFGLVTRDTLEHVREVFDSDPRGRKLGQHIVSAGAMNGHDLWRAIQLQIGEICQALMGVRSGSFVFVDAPGEPSLESHVALDTQAVLLEGARRADELAHFRRKLPHADLVPRPTGRGAPQDLGPNERRVLEAIDGKRSLAELGMVAMLGEFEATKSVHRLLEIGLTQVDVPPREATPPPRGTLSPLIERYNAAFVEIVRVLMESWVDGPYRISLDAYLQAEKDSALTGLALESDGSLPTARLLANADRVGGEASAKSLEAMLEFALFQARNILDPSAADALSKSALALALA